MIHIIFLQFFNSSNTFSHCKYLKRYKLYTAQMELKILGFTLKTYYPEISQSRVIFP